MKKKFEHIYAYGWCCLLLLLAVGCQRDELTPAEGGEEIFTLRCVPEDMEGELRTRTTGIENTVEDYAVLIFQNRNGGTPRENVLVKKVVTLDVTGFINFSMAQSTKQHYLYVVANSQGELKSLKEYTSTELDFLNIRVSHLNPDNSLPAAPFGMCSSRIVLSNLSFKAFQDANLESADVLLKKNVAKFSIKFTVSPKTFEPVSVEYRQMCDYGYLAETGVEPSSDPMDYLLAMKLQSGAWTKPVYVYEQKCSVRDADWRHPGFYVLLSGYYKGSKSLSYYRFALPTSGNTFSDIKRNVSHVLTVTDIRNPGYTSPEEASTSPFLNNVVVNLTPDVTGLEKMKEIYTSGFYEMGLEASVAWIYRSAGNYTQPICTVMTKTLGTVPTDSKLNLKYENGENGISIEELTSGTYLLSYNAAKTSGSSRVDKDGFYTADLIFGTLRKEVKVKIKDGLEKNKSYAIKFKCSNGKVKSQLNPGPVEDWIWSSQDWCGLGPNSTYDKSRYYGEIMNSTDENIFIHVKSGVGTDGGRMVELIDRNNMVRVFLWKKN